MSRFAVLPALLLASALGACAHILDPGDAKVLGTVEFYGEPVLIDVPDTAVVGAPFEVRVDTYGGGCETQGPTEVETAAAEVVISPYEFTRTGEDVVCTTVLKRFEHRAVLTPSVRGELRLVVRGRSEPSGVERTFVRTVVVR